MVNGGYRITILLLLIAFPNAISIIYCGYGNLMKTEIGYTRAPRYVICIVPKHSNDLMLAALFTSFLTS